MPPIRATPVSAPPRVRDLVGSAPDGALAVVHRGQHAVYVDLGGWCLGVVAQDAAQVPCALRVAAPDLRVFPGRSAYVAGGVLHLDGTPLVVGRVVDVRVPRVGREGTATTGPVSARVSPQTAVTGFVQAVGLPADPAHRDAALAPALVERLVGRGDGLTPLGDDLLCGWLAVHRSADVATPTVDAAVLGRLPSTTLLSATLLDCAMHGEVLPQFSTWLSALGTPHEHTTTAALAAVGHTSGAGMIYGARMALEELRRIERIAA